MCPLPQDRCPWKRLHLGYNWTLKVFTSSFTYFISFIQVKTIAYGWGCWGPWPWASHTTINTALFSQLSSPSHPLALFDQIRINKFHKIFHLQALITVATMTSKKSFLCFIFGDHLHYYAMSRQAQYYHTNYKDTMTTMSFLVALTKSNHGLFCILHFFQQRF